MIEMSLGKRWTGYSVVPGKELRKLPPGCKMEQQFMVGYDIKFPDSIAELELKLDLKLAIIFSDCQLQFMANRTSVSCQASSVLNS